MELYNKERITSLIETSHEGNYYMPKKLFDQIKSIRLETKMAYVAMLDTLIKSATYDSNGLAYICEDNVEIQKTLIALANKEVNYEKIVKYINELSDADLIKVENEKIYIYAI